MAKAYFGSRISANMITTPEGYLVCKNVPIARVGHQEYLGAEFKGPVADRLYDVTRPEQEVFDKAAIASFEGKPVVDEHPDEDVTPENYSRYMKGVCREVRRGEGDLQNCLIGDLIIYDRALIDKIKNGKREISCGYDCLWCQTGDRSFEQREIRGNHIAVVNRGRAGHKIAIRDTAERSKNMKKSILERMFAAFAKDEAATPEDILEASKTVNAANDTTHATPAPTPAPAPAPAQPPKPAIDADLDARLKRIEDALASITAQKQQPPAEEADEDLDALDALESELQDCQTTDDEDDVVENPDVINQQADDEDPDDEDVDPAPVQLNAASRDAAMQAVRNLRPVVASLPPSQRKKAADSLAMIIRGQVAKDSGYAALQKAKRSVAKDREPLDDKEYGRQIRDKYNPHYRK